jgi:hypothetical protein
MTVFIIVGNRISSSVVMNRKGNGWIKGREHRHPISVFIPANFKRSTDNFGGVCTHDLIEVRDDNVGPYELSIRGWFSTTSIFRDRCIKDPIWIWLQEETRRKPHEVTQ